MPYQAQEGTDYIVDLYRIAGAEHDATEDNIKQLLNARAREYHPDRLQGLAPEFTEKGERMARLINRAKIILLNPEKRREYDEILTAWEGPVSQDGVPIMAMDEYMRAEMSQKTPEEIEAVFAAKREQVLGLVGHNPKQQLMLERMLATATGKDADEIREALDAALLAEDQVLAIEEADRGILIGLPKSERYETLIGYVENVALAIEAARTAQAEKQKHRALGGVSTRLALMAGEQDTLLALAAITGDNTGLPHYFDTQAEKVTELAKKRETLLKKRLELFEPAYPIAEVQTETHSNFIVGITTESEAGSFTWLGFQYDKEARALTNIAVGKQMQQLLAKSSFNEVYESGFNIFTVTAKAHIDLRTMLKEACNKHVQKYFSNL